MGAELVHFDPRSLEGIAAGEISLAFRKWIRPTVAAGATLRTAAGTLVVGEITRVEEAEITEEEARRAGCASRKELLAELDAGRPGWIHRIEIRALDRGRK